VRLDIRYETRFRYDAPVRESHNELRACPVDDRHQRVLDFRLRVDPAATVQSFRDYWGTRVDTFGVTARHDRLDVIAEISVETTEREEVPVPATPIAELAQDEDFHEYTVPSRHTGWSPEVADLARSVAADAESAEDAGRRLAGWVQESLSYAPGTTTVDTTIEQVFDQRAGVCQDFAHLMVALCRSLGLPARYVSGYLFARRDDASDQPRSDEDEEVRVQTHAWVEVGTAPSRWLALDPTNGRPVGERHVKIGHGRDYFDVTPFHGSFSGRADPTLVSAVDIRRRSDDRAPILSAADRGLLRRPAPQDLRRAHQQQQQ
jgi:transglutaminase-like putative cysteine protease